MAAFFVLTIPTAAYEQKLLADRDQNADGKKGSPLVQGGNTKGFLGLAPVQESTLLQNRLDNGLKPARLLEVPGSLFILVFRCH